MKRRFLVTGGAFAGETRLKCHLSNEVLTAVGRDGQAAVWKLLNDYPDELHDSTLVLPGNLFDTLPKVNHKSARLAVGRHVAHVDLSDVMTETLSLVCDTIESGGVVVWTDGSTRKVSNGQWDAGWAIATSSGEVFVGSNRTTDRKAADAEKIALSEARSRFPDALIVTDYKNVVEEARKAEARASDPARYPRAVRSPFCPITWSPRCSDPVMRFVDKLARRAISGVEVGGGGKLDDDFTNFIKVDIPTLLDARKSGRFVIDC